MTGADLERRYPNDQLAPYAVMVARNVYFDAACARGIGSVANGAMSRASSNVVIAMHKGVPWLRSTATTAEGAEIINSYGRRYFDGNIDVSQTCRCGSGPKRNERRSNAPSRNTPLRS